MQTVRLSNGQVTTSSESLRDRSRRRIAGRSLPDRREGFTLIETAVVLVLLSVVLGGLFTVLFDSYVFSAEFTREGVVEETGWRISARLVDELSNMDSTSLLPIVIDNSNYIEFREVVDIDGVTGSPILGNYIVIGWELEPGETLNGLDDDGDGRIDEGYVSRLDKGNTTPYGGYPVPGQWKTAGLRTLVQLAGNVLGLRFNSTVGGLSYSVDVGLVDADGVVTQKTFTRRIAFRDGNVGGSAGPGIPTTVQGLHDYFQDYAVNNPGPAGDAAEDIREQLATALVELAKDPPDNEAAAEALEDAQSDLQEMIDDALIDPYIGQQLMDQISTIISGL